MTTNESDSRQALRDLEPLIGTWQVQTDSGTGTVRYAVADHGPWLVQHVELAGEDGPQRGVEYIGHDPGTGTLRSHYFSSSGEILEYTYEMTGPRLRIYFGGTDSPAYFEGTFDADGARNVGRWQWPGGGYDSTMTRLAVGPQGLEP